MSAPPVSLLQHKIYTQLTQHAPLMAVLMGVYDYVPASASFPYLVMEDARVSAWEFLGAEGFRVDFTLDVYSREKGRKQVLELAESVHALLHRQTLSVTGYAAAPLEVAAAEYVKEADGITRQARLRVRCYVEAAV